jgi:hypothetical protein
LGDIGKKYWTIVPKDFRLESANGAECSYPSPTPRNGADMQSMKPIMADSLMSAAEAQFESPKYPQTISRKGPRRSSEVEPLLTADDVAKRLNVSTDWVWDHSSRKKPLLPVIRMGDGTLRYRPSGIEAFIDERERVSSMGRRAS